MKQTNTGHLHHHEAGKTRRNKSFHVIEIWVYIHNVHVIYKGILYRRQIYRSSRYFALIFYSFKAVSQKVVQIKKRRIVKPYKR